MPEEPITVFISRRFKPGTEKAVAKWTEEIRAACAAHPGFLGAVTLEPHDANDQTSHIAFRFSSFENLKCWEESPERLEFYRRLQPLLEEQHASHLSGFEPWFPSGGNGPASPAKWKMWLMALLAVFPTALLVRVLLGPFLKDLPLTLAVFISCVPISFLMSFFAMPWLGKIFRNWLYPPEN